MDRGAWWATVYTVGHNLVIKQQLGFMEGISMIMYWDTWFDPSNVLGTCHTVFFNFSNIFTHFIGEETETH